MSRVTQMLLRQLPKQNQIAKHRNVVPFIAWFDAKLASSGQKNIPQIFSSRMLSVASRMNAANQESNIERSQAGKNNNNAAHTRIDELVHANKIVVFMKGVPDKPLCGFSNAVVQILRMHGVSDFDAHNVLEDEVLRQGIKEYSSWPTIPQVYINGEFVGGSDILLQLHQNGELIDELQKAGISSALVSKELKDQEKKKTPDTD